MEWEGKLREKGNSREKREEEKEVIEGGTEGGVHNAGIMIWGKLLKIER